MLTLNWAACQIQQDSGHSGIPCQSCLVAPFALDLPLSKILDHSRLQETLQLFEDIKIQFMAPLYFVTSSYP